ncbi:aldehyde dehydrogenase family protein [Priestia filamentosa]|uniref:Aldehyde dehydrogenase n=1 Tax=Priestia filamentosa TaxID=1402861 RepID=A0A1X7DNM5_9BACI|nr:aldehyde dehydrogenase family protein [Priestia filamentosa]AKO93266.1 aldehyde dehydrogenase [Priestia filamentosa]MDT3763420.1 aldehyde dehydrogenase family protein [Priestia filamentosa]OXS72086.1 aldehyde dehydrogenase [Priestia filamentosa]RJS63440.1 aldehyde dehydrogenase [Priestia filamentosa]WRU93863.1 aldehyde dehydrogenase family protein [Priestia filamentosa]
MLKTNFRKSQPYIQGEWISGERETVTITSPYTNEVIGEQLLSTEEDVEKALVSVYEAKKEIAAIPSHKRAKILKRVAYLLEERKEEFAKLISLELGKPLKNTLDEVSRSIETFELSGEEAKRLMGETLPGDASERGTKAIASTFRVPVGVVAAITPFNAPLNLVCHKIGPAFAAGNTVILKPSSQTTLVATELIKLLLEAGFPKNAISMVLGRREVVQQIVKDDRVNVISFTGGTVASRNICKLAGMKKVLLELGGNAATIIHDDSDITRAAKMCAKTGFSNSGQSCISVQRIYVHQSVVDKFTNLLKEEVLKLKIGDPLLPDTDVGCVVDQNAAMRVKEWIEEAVELGAKVICGGNRSGATVEPTILLNPPKKSKVICEEVFGPIVSIIPYETIEEAIEEANDSSFGLQAGIFTNQIDLAYKVASKLDMGGVVINGTSNFRLDHWPYGGVKDSGIGREGPRYAIEDMTETKMIVLQLSDND